jgi:ABC-type sulfate transport system permease subunit
MKKLVSVLAACGVIHAVLLGLLSARVVSLIREDLFFQTIHGDPARLSFLPLPLIVLAIAVPIFFLSSLCLSYFLFTRRHRGASLSLAALSCLAIPVGTILGPLTIYALTRPAIRSQFVM